MISYMNFDNHIGQVTQVKSGHSDASTVGGSGHEKAPAAGRGFS